MAYARLMSLPSGRETYNLFRRHCAPDLLCAVAQSHPVPDFIDGAGWAFAGTVRSGGAGPAGFRAEDARIGAQLNGFYLFLAHAPAAGSAARRAA